MKTELEMKEKLEELKKSESECVKRIASTKQSLIILERNLEQIRGAISITEEFLSDNKDVEDEKNDIENKKKELKNEKA